MGIIEDKQFVNIVIKKVGDWRISREGDEYFVDVEYFTSVGVKARKHEVDSLLSSAVSKEYIAGNRILLKMTLKDLFRISIKR
jgi:hypothetical protein